MSIRTEPLIGVTRAQPRRRPASLAAWLDREPVFSWLMMTAPILFLAAFVGYPFVYGILLSLQDRPVAHVGTFVGLKNFIKDFYDPTFWRVAVTTFVYTRAAAPLKSIGARPLAVAMHQNFRITNLVGR